MINIPKIIMIVNLEIQVNQRIKLNGILNEKTQFRLSTDEANFDDKFRQDKKDF